MSWATAMLSMLSVMFEPSHTKLMRCHSPSVMVVSDSKGVAERILGPSHHSTPPRRVAYWDDYVFLGRASLYVLCSSLCGPWKHCDMPGTMGLRTMSAAPSDSQCNALRDSTSIPPLAQVMAAHRQEPPASVCKFPRRNGTRKQVTRRQTDPGRGRTGPRCKGPMREYSRRSE